MIIIHMHKIYLVLWEGHSQATFVSFINHEAYMKEDSNLHVLWWKEQLIRKTLMKISLHQAQENRHLIV